MKVTAVDKIFVAIPNLLVIVVRKNYETDLLNCDLLHKHDYGKLSYVQEPHDLELDCNELLMISDDDL